MQRDISNDAKNAVTRPRWLKALLFTAPLVIYAFLLYLTMQSQGYLTESLMYPLWLLAIFSLPWSIPIGGLFFAVWGSLMLGPREPASDLFVVSLAVGAFFGTWVNGYFCVRRWST